MQDIKWHYWVCVAGVMLITALSVFYPPLFLQFLENKGFDFRFLMRGERPVNDEILIVGIDDQSLEDIGRWPWSRKTTAKLIEAISDSHPGVMGIDMLFSEPESNPVESPGHEAIEGDQSRAELKNHLKRNRNSLTADNQLAATIKNAANVVLPIGMFVGNQTSTMPVTLPDILFDFPFMSVKELPYNAPLLAFKALAPIDELAYEAASLGHVYTMYDPDGAIRWEPLYIRMGGYYFPSFNLEISRLFLGVPRHESRLMAGEAVVLGNAVIPVDTHGRSLINYAGPQGTFQHISAVDVMQRKIDPSLFRDKIVLLGVTALGGTDTHVTPFAHLSGVEKQANVIENIIHRRFMQQEEFTRAGIMIFALFAGIVFLFTLPRVHVMTGAMITLALLGLYLLATQYLFVSYNLRVDFVAPSIAVLLMYTLMTAVRFLMEERKTQAAIALTDKLLKEQLQLLLESFIDVISNAIDEKSPYTGGHCRRVPELAMIIAQAANEETSGPLADFSLSSAELYEMKIASMLHDCGKITTPVHVVDKGTKLETIYDRIHALDLRHELLRRDMLIEEMSKNPGENVDKIMERIKQPWAELEEEIAFLRKSNTGGEYMAPEKQQRVLAIAESRSWIDANGERQPLLSEDEINNLNIQKGTLTDEEREIINNHVVSTISMLKSLPFPKHLTNVPEIAGGHHERMDGKGYPNGLTRDQMSMQARILGIADIFEALTANDRPYKKSMPVSRALSILESMKNEGHIDPELFDLFVEKKLYLTYGEKFLDETQSDIDDYQLKDAAVTRN